MISRRSFMGTVGGVLSVAALGEARVRLPQRPAVTSRSVVFKHPNGDPYDLTNKYGFNHAASVTTLADGRLLASWFSGPYEGSVHQVILSAHSDDQGRTWSPAEVLQDEPRKSDFDPAFIRDGRRTWFFYSVGRWNRYPFVQDQASNVGIKSFKLYYRWTDDSGKTWSERQLALEGLGIGCRSNGIALSTGELVLPLHGYVSGVASVLKSSDRGRTWRRCGHVTTATVAHEPSVAELPSGELLMAIRTRDGHLWTSRSRDKGETWAAAEQSPLVAAASSHNVLRLRDGRIVLTHNESKPPLRTPLTMRVSGDGATWGEPVRLSEVPIPGPNDDAWSRQVSYPSATELSDGSVLAVWGEIYVGALTQYGDIHAARVTL